MDGEGGAAQKRERNKATGNLGENKSKPVVLKPKAAAPGKWVGKDLDLKNLIELTVHWIEIEEHTKDVVEDMPKGKK